MAKTSQSKGELKFTHKEPNAFGKGNGQNPNQTRPSHGWRKAFELPRLSNERRSRGFSPSDWGRPPITALGEWNGRGYLLQVNQHFCCRLAAALDSLDQQLLHRVLQGLRKL